MIDPEYPWPPLGQAWTDLPESTRTAMVATGAAAWEQVFHGRATYNKQWRLARPPVLTADAFRELNEVCDRIVQLILEACRRRARTAGELRRLLDLPVGENALLDEDEPLHEGLLAAYRPDVLYSGGVPCIVEYNIDSSLGGGFDADTVIHRYAELYRSAGLLDGVRPAPSLLDQRFAAIRDTLGLPDGARVALLMDFDAEYPGLDDPETFIRILSPLVDQARPFGIDLVIGPVASATLDDRRRLVVGGAPVDALFRLFVPNRVTPSAGLDAVAGALAAGTLPMFVSSAAWLLSNKINFAWLWADLDLLTETDRALVRRYVPHTVALTADQLDRALAEQADLVAKPAGGSAGHGVLIGRAMSPADWAEGVRAAIGAGGHILQRYHEADRVSMDFVQIETGETVSAEVPYSLAPYLFGRTGSGALARVGYPGCEEILNLARGVLMTGILLTD
ncbi:circularly permuted type 2 ATP-grasp protein [Micromonospora auratinigra]|uniref:Circularly permuted ATP-grasp type 2 n=1 Tax=Micromonospora auratinigra TaxID=261654 RepID=A0A1A8ZDW4_9ACTN|nr:circularly permuted type 2 ATP-grasp protein [Micromonospora auratinigra]SBT42180.1 Circularly permuted ATP-grasp type 2 [Micromonospora auratinigra]